VQTIASSSHSTTKVSALSNLDAYSPYPVPIQLKEVPVWRQAMKAAEKRMKRAEGVTPRPAATQEEVDKAAFTATCHPQVRCILLLAWLTAARVGCIRQLRRSDITLYQDGRLLVQFRRGKGAQFSGPYTVPTRCSNRRWFTKSRSSCRPFRIPRRFSRRRHLVAIATRAERLRRHCEWAMACWANVLSDAGPSKLWQSMEYPWRH
jgi:integrase